MDMNNPQMQAMASAMMSDPEMMQMMMQPGMMQKLQAAMADPQSAMGDPDVQKIAMKMQSLGMGGGGGGGMGGAGGYGAPAAASGAAAGGVADIKHVTTESQLDALIAAAGPKLVVVDFFTTWCGPCKAIAPLFEELAASWNGKVVFVKVDGDRSRELVQSKGVTGFPTFHFYSSGQLVDSFSGADSRRLREIVEEHGERASAPPPCPYKHFPLKDAEQVKYADIKWELVEPKFKEANDKLAAAGDAAAAQVLSDAELASIASLVATLKDRAHYHDSKVSVASASAVTRMLSSWPKESQGPAVNLARMAVLHPAAAKLWADASDKKANGGGAGAGAGAAASAAAAPATADDLISPLLSVALGAEKSVTALLVLRTLCNCFARRVLARSLLRRAEEVLEALGTLYKKFEDEQTRVAAVALLINYSILLSEIAPLSESDHAAKVLLLTSAQECLQTPPASVKLVYRCMVVLGTLAYNDAATTELAGDLDVLDAVNTAAKLPACRQDEPTQQAAAEIAKLLKK